MAHSKLWILMFALTASFALGDGDDAQAWLDEDEAGAATAAAAEEAAPSGFELQSSDPRAADTTFAQSVAETLGTEEPGAASSLSVPRFGTTIDVMRATGSEVSYGDRLTMRRLTFTSDSEAQQYFGQLMNTNTPNQILEVRNSTIVIAEGPFVGENLGASNAFLEAAWGDHKHADDPVDMRYARLGDDALVLHESDRVKPENSKVSEYYTIMAEPGTYGNGEHLNEDAMTFTSDMGFGAEFASEIVAGGDMRSMWFTTNPEKAAAVESYSASFQPPAPVRKGIMQRLRGD